MRTIIFLFTAFTCCLAQHSAQELFDNMQAASAIDNCQATLVQRITTTSGSIRELTYESYSTNDSEKSLMRYIAPSRVKGNALLMTEHSDNIWMFNKRTNRVRKLASHAKKQKFEGSDFTFEDMGSGDVWRENYTPQLAGEGKIKKTVCWKIALLPKSKDAGYSKICCWLRKGDFYPMQFDYYDDNGTFLKSLYLQQIDKVSGITIAQKFVMENHIDKTKTEMEYLKINFDISFPDQFFSERQLRN